MKISILLLGLIFGFQAISQIETIKLNRKNPSLYIGQGQEIENWYFFIDTSSICYLANLEIPQEEVEEWFNKRKNSNNIFKGAIEHGQFKTLSLTKDNDVEISMNFYLYFDEKQNLILTAIDDNRQYVFYRK
jgi:hypothetical protein